MKRPLFFSVRPSRMRRGSVVLEAVLASALLATAGVTLARLAQSSAALNRQSDQQLAATLAADNVMHRLDGLSVEDVRSSVDKTCASISRSSGCDVQAIIDDVVGVDARGIHVRVEVTTGGGGRVRRHHWKFNEPEGDAGDQVLDESEAS
ncbi:hypothetical protein Poly51_50450 [Rubripirellula tenax]|uniref:Uncharacterized protein n=1 Tax=Rubripirellula tenax TaxID=2528015 RepID=A0A5C6EHZ0_9BACT|nr:hypothetical protein [Rubripirellula tenax]TWU47246.1 hypothetical protein Poly51_50450 [Rubripirellula tenax]